MRKISRRKGNFLGNKNEAVNFGRVTVVSLLLVVSILTVSFTPIGASPLPAKTLWGTASRCDGGSVAGASVSVSSGLGTKTTTVITTSWQVDIGSDTGTEWPDGTFFTVTITMSGWSGTKTGTVSGDPTNAGNVALTPTTALSATANANPLTVLVGDTVTFTGSAVGGASPYTWSWNFNGEGSSALQNPTFSFSTSGSKNCVLTVTDPCDSDTDSVTVQVNPALSGSGGGPYSGDVCNPVSFSGSATGGLPPYSYSWSFSDGGSASVQNPTHQFSSDGSYTATLTVTDSDSPPNTYVCSPASVTISTATLVAGAGGPYSGNVCNPVSFSGSATGGCTPYTYSWSFSDGGSASVQNPTHQFSSDGSYSATVTVTSADGQSDFDTASVTISTATLVANAGSSYSGTVGNSIQFSGSATGGCTPYSWEWDFGDGTAHSYTQSPSHQYTSAGSYTVTLTVNSADGQTDVDTATATVNDAPLNAQAGGPYTGNVGVDIQFYGSATGGMQPYSYIWNFGDGQTSSSQYPEHAYTTPGTFDVSLTVRDDNGDQSTDYTTATVYSSDTPVANTNGPYEGEVGEEIEFVGTATGGTQPYNWYWEFGDGEDNTSDEQNPEHIYLTPGIYIANLTVTDSYGISSIVDNTTVTIIPPNDPPEKPETPSGPSGKAGEEYAYSTSTNDPDGNEVYYLWDWGDGTDSGWVGPYDSGAAASMSNSWEEQGDYEVKVKAKDTSGEESEWSDPLPISMPRNIQSDNPVLLWIVENLIERFPILEKMLQPIYDILISA